MKSTFFLSCIMTLAVFAADFTVDNKAIVADFAFKGGGITPLTRKKNNAVLSFPGHTSVTERVFAQAGEVSLQETFANLEYRMVSYTRTPQRGYDVTLTTQGAACFDWLRITKTFQFPANEENFTVLYTLKNLDGKPHYAGIWLQTFFALYDEAGSANLILQPRKGEWHEFTHPGTSTHDEWGPAPSLSLLSIGGKETSQGMVMTLPPDICGGFYNWCSTRQSAAINTSEMITRELEVPANGEISFTATFTISDNAAALARKMAQSPDYKQALSLAKTVSEARPGNHRIATLVRPLEGLQALRDGAMLPKFTATDIKGKPISSGDLYAPVNVITTWSSWNYESQNIQRQLRRREKEKGVNRLRILSICLDANAKECRRLMDRDSITWATICDERMWDNPILTTLGLSRIPDNIITNSQGRILAHSLPVAELNKKLDELLK